MDSATGGIVNLTSDEAKFLIERIGFSRNSIGFCASHQVSMMDVACLRKLAPIANSTVPGSRRTLSFHKVMFTAQEILDLLGEFEEGNSLGDFELRFVELAEKRSREGIA